MPNITVRTSRLTATSQGPFPRQHPTSRTQTETTRTTDTQTMTTQNNGSKMFGNLAHAVLEGTKQSKSTGGGRNPSKRRTRR